MDQKARHFKIKYFILYSLFSASFFLMVISLWLVFSTLRMVPIIAVSGAVAYLALMKMKKTAGVRKIVRDIFPTITWTAGILFINVYVEFLYGADGLDATKYMTEWWALLILAAVVVVNKFFSMYYDEKSVQ